MHVSGEPFCRLGIGIVRGRGGGALPTLAHIISRGQKKAFLPFPFFFFTRRLYIKRGRGGPANADVTSALSSEA